MKRIAPSIAFLLLAATTLLADEAPAPASQPKHDNGAHYYIDAVDPIVNLTDEQKERINQIFEDGFNTQQTVAEKNADKTKAAQKTFAEAQKNGDDQAMAMAMETLQLLQEPLMKVSLKFQADLKKVLTREQHAKLTDAQAAQLIKALTEPAVLKPDQIRQMKAAYKEMVDNPDPEHPVNIMQFVDDILTPEQKKIIQHHRVLNYAKEAFAAAKLTDDQFKRLGRICDDALADPETAPRVYEIMHNRIGEILTKEQRKALDPNSAQDSAK